ncbi:MAG: hypothetical protein RBU37_12010 [Myxococcota bacterium]|jgi:hypothetical protein|nr:hypothetical protein [Myxococcota bacterium]
MNNALDCVKTLWSALLQAHRKPGLLTAHLLLVVATLVMAFIPLFNLLAFEFTMVLATLAALLVPLTTLSLLKHDASLREALPAKALWQLVLHGLALLLPSLALISANALRVQNCNYSEGFALFLLMPVVTVVFASTLTLAGYRMLGGRRWLTLLLYYLVFVLSLIGGVAQLVLEPPIVLVNPFVGYFAGSIYDEALGIPQPLLVYRLALLALCVGLVMCWDVAAAVQTRLRARSSVPESNRMQATLGAVLVGLVLLTHAHHRELGYSMDRVALEEALSYRVETEHFELFMSPSGDWSKRAEELAEDHEFRYHQLAQFLGVQPEQRIRSYIYPDRDLKGRLMGSKRTLVAKLWLGEIHLIYGQYGDSLCKHEMAHVFSAALADGPLHLPSRYGVLVNVGLIEGIAVAAEWPANEFTPHAWAAALHQLELAPPINSILAPTGFWSQHSKTAYTLMGSFVRWLIDEYGMAQFAQAYRSADLEAAYGRSVDELVEEWKAFLSTFPLSTELLEMARYYYDRPSIFAKVCARDLAERTEQAAQLSASGRHPDAVKLMQAVLEKDDSPFRQRDLLTILVRAKEYEAAQALALELLDDERLGVVDADSLRQDLADIYWRRGELEKAQALYTELVSKTALPSAVRRTLRVKLLTCADERLRELGFRYFFDELDAARRLALLYEAQLAYPGEALLHYLSALVLSSLREHEASWRQAELSLSLQALPADLLENAQFVAAEAAYHRKHDADAIALFSQLAQSAQYDGSRARAHDWLQRIEWRRQRASND